MNGFAATSAGFAEVAVGELDEGMHSYWEKEERCEFLSEAFRAALSWIGDAVPDGPAVDPT